MNLRDYETELRERYYQIHRRGMPMRMMSEYTGLPISAISMWLSEYRPINKIDKLQALADGIDGLEDFAELMYG